MAAQLRDGSRNSDEYSRRFALGMAYTRRHLEPLLPRLHDLRAQTFGVDFEWAIPLVEAVEAEMTEAGNLFCGLPIVTDAALTAATVRIVEWRP